MKLEICQCGVEAVHFRIYSGAERTYNNGQPYSKPFFSQAHALRDLACQMYEETRQSSRTPSERRLEDSRLIHQFVAENLERLPPQYRQMFKKVEALVNNPNIPKTDQLAWGALPVHVRDRIRTFYFRGAGALNPMYWPGATGTSMELASLQGRNPPNDPLAKCHIISGLYAPGDYPGTVES